MVQSYQIMKELLGLDSDEIGRIFSNWNQGDLDSYLIEITADIFTYKDADGTPLVEKILDAAGQKGTGRWTAVSALEAGQPLTLLAEVSGDDHAQFVQLMTEYDPQPPFNAGSLATAPDAIRDRAMALFA